MVRCAEFYERWKKDPNWCQKSPDTVNQIDHYLGLVNELENLGVETAAIYKKFPEGVARDILKIKDDVVRAGIVGNAAGKIKRGDRVSSADVKVWAGLEETPKRSTPMPDVTDPTIVGSPSPVHGVKSKKTEEFLTSVPPAPCTIPIPSDPTKPVQPSLAAQQAAKEQPAPNSSEIPNSSPAWTPALCKTGPCPDGKSHNSHDKVRGLCCDLTGQPVNQIGACAFLERQKRAGGFTTAAGNPSPIKVLQELGGVKIVKTPMTDQERKDWADAGIDKGGFFTKKEVEQIDELVTVHYEGIKNRADFFWRAACWFLAQAEGE